MKGQEISINVIIAAVIVLFVGMVIIAIFAGGVNNTLPFFQKQENCDAHNGKCIPEDSACDGLTTSFKCPENMRCCINQ